MTDLPCLVRRNPERKKEFIVEIPLKIFRDPDKPKRDCMAIGVVQELIRRKMFKSYNPSGKGNCHEATTGLLIDLGESGLYSSGWLYVQGICKEPQGFHSWLEYDGWVVDCSNGEQSFVPTEDYYSVKEVKDVKRFTLQEIQEKLRTRTGRKELNIFEEVN